MNLCPRAQHIGGTEPARHAKSPPFPRRRRNTQEQGKNNREADSLRADHDPQPRLDRPASLAVVLHCLPLRPCHLRQRQFSTGLSGLYLLCFPPSQSLTRRPNRVGAGCSPGRQRPRSRAERDVTKVPETVMVVRAALKARYHWIDCSPLSDAVMRLNNLILVVGPFRSILSRYGRRDSRRNLGYHSKRTRSFHCRVALRKCGGLIHRILPGGTTKNAMSCATRLVLPI